MSRATRRLRYQLATTILHDLGQRELDKADELDQDRVAEAQAALCSRMQDTIKRLCDIGITKARIARELDVDPGALSDLSEGETSRLGLESLWEAYAALVSFLDQAGDNLRNSSVTTGHAELL